MKKVLVDIYHLPQYNFFKHTILSLPPDQVDIFCVDRGKLVDVIKYELPGYNLTTLGSYKHNKGMFSMITKIILPRTMSLFKRISRRSYKFVVTANYQANFVAKLKGIPNIGFNDDPRKFVFPVLKMSADEVYIPPFSGEYKGTRKFNALKEWAYLSPSYFRPNADALEPYGVKPKAYIFIREVSTETSNYLDQDEDIVLSVSKNFPKDIPVLLSLENKQNKGKYPSHWTILEEPVRDIHSLMYHSKLVISSGDSMAREGAMLGVPAIYAGFRDMPANDILIEMKMLDKVEPKQLIRFVEEILSGQRSYIEQETFRRQLNQNWDDVTQLILDKVNQL
ncbi:MAG: DUF354 domain-containing protein [Bacteroidota bacterium]